ncbi:MAG: hypothetical protein HOQ22_18635, partial [Nocardioidaceae bacterium]|nr:hypothetical protein [Nocardioidaceae bacterium]
MTYQLASLDLATDFDRPLAPLTVPGKAVKGDSAGLVLLDGAARGAYRLARLVRQEALLGLSVTRPDLPVDVHLVLVVDAFSDDMWRRSRDLEEDAVVPRRHRLARVSVQGRQRAAVLLEPAPLDGSVASQRLTVRVRPEELGSGLLTLGFDVPREVPSWLGGAVLEDGLTGVCIARVSLEPATETLTGSLSTGFAGSKRRRLVPRYPGGFVVNPAPAGRTDVVLRPRVLEQRPR